MAVVNPAACAMGRKGECEQSPASYSGLGLCHAAAGATQPPPAAAMSGCRLRAGLRAASPRFQQVILLQLCYFLLFFLSPLSFSFLSLILGSSADGGSGIHQYTCIRRQIDARIYRTMMTGRRMATEWLCGRMSDGDGKRSNI